MIRMQILFSFIGLGSQKVVFNFGSVKLHKTELVLFQDNAKRCRHDRQSCSEMGIYSRNFAVMPVFRVVLGIYRQ